MLWAEAKTAQVLTGFRSVGRGRKGLEYGTMLVKSLLSITEPKRGKRNRNVTIFISVHEGEAPFYQNLKKGDIIRIAGCLEQQKPRKGKDGAIIKSGWIYIHPETIMMLQTVDGRAWNVEDYKPAVEDEHEEHDSEVPV